MSADMTLLIPQSLYERAERVAQRQQRNTSELVAELLAKGLPDLEKSVESSDRERAKVAYRQLHPKLLKNHPNEFVAIYLDELVDHDSDRTALLNRIDQNFPDVFVLVRQVTPEIEIVYEHRGLRWA